MFKGSFCVLGKPLCILNVSLVSHRMLRITQDAGHTRLYTLAEVEIMLMLFTNVILLIHF